MAEKIIKFIEEKKEKITSFLRSNPPPSVKKDPNKIIRFIYGTSGIRLHHTLLDNAVIKCALFSIFRSISMDFKSVGIMITASHNHCEDNGIKLADSNGSLLSPIWEKTLIEFLNNNDSEVDKLISLVKYCKNKNDGIPSIFIGRDSRDHSDRFLDLILGLFEIFKDVVHFENFGYTTTPQLFYLVKSFNEKNISSESSTLNKPFGLEDYFINLSETYKSFQESSFSLFQVTNKNKLFVDCSNGVVSCVLETLNNYLNRFFSILSIECYNKFRKGNINDLCGSKYVMTTKKFPINYKKSEINVTFDGDGDRVLFLTEDETNTEKLLILDGDHILVLFVKYILLLMSKIRKFFFLFANYAEYKFGVILTGYSNGATIDYIKDLGLKPIISKTGIKNLYAKAKEYDIALYFERNGHGTCFFSEMFKKDVLNEINRLNSFPTKTDTEKKELKILDCFLQLSKFSNSNYADAISCMLMLNVIIQSLKLDLVGAFNMFEKRPSITTYINVANRNLIKSLSEDELTILNPKELQCKIDDLSSSKPKTRCFVRPSGTENILRIYVETKNQEDLDGLCEDMVNLVKEFLKIN